jgi:hypothetical protein
VDLEDIVAEGLGIPPALQKYKTTPMVTGPVKSCTVLAMIKPSSQLLPQHTFQWASAETMHGRMCMVYPSQWAPEQLAACKEAYCSAAHALIVCHLQCTVDARFALPVIFPSCHTYNVIDGGGGGLCQSM